MVTSWYDRPIEKARVKPGYGRPKQPRSRGNRLPPPELRVPSEPPPRIGPSADDIIDWIQRKLYVPEGKLLGQKFVLADWQKDCLYKIYDNDVGTRRAILSFGRKNGKTALAALLLLVHLCGPKARPNSQLFSAAQSREQAALIFHMAAKIVRMSPEVRGAVIIRESSKELRCPELGTKYRALAAEATTAYGLSPVFIVHDEIGQVDGPRSELYEALETATGAQEDPLSIIISTQAATDADLLSVLIDDAITGADPRTIVKLYTAPLTDDPFAIETIRKANPALGNFLNEKEVMAMAADAKRMRAREAEFRNLILNQRVEACNPFVSPAEWAACGATIERPLAELEGCDVYAGLDLSEVVDLTALVLIGQKDGVWHVHPTFWLPGKNLADKARADRVPYDEWAARGWLQTTPSSAIHYDQIAAYLRDVFDKYRIAKVGFDRWNFVHLKPCLERVGFTEQKLTEQWQEFGQGTKSMSPALRTLQALIVDQQLRHGNHKVLTMCAMNAVIEGDQTKDASNRKLSKKKSSGRIDGMVALAMAVGVAPLGAKRIDIEALIG